MRKPFPVIVLVCVLPVLASGCRRSAPDPGVLERAPSSSPPAMADLHYHWEGKADLDEKIAASAARGVTLGVTAEAGWDWGLSDDAKLLGFLAQLEGKPVYKGLQVYDGRWPTQYSTDTLRRLDYVAADALMLPLEDGTVVPLWKPDVTFPDAQAFMDRYVTYNLQVLGEPIDIWSNPTYLPESLQASSDELWTEDRMLTLIRAAVANGVAIEVNSRYEIPSPAFLELAKAEGATFSFGSNRHDDEPGDLEFCTRMYRELGLGPEDMYTPAGARVGTAGRL